MSSEPTEGHRKEKTSYEKALDTGVQALNNPDATSTTLEKAIKQLKGKVPEITGAYSLLGPNRGSYRRKDEVRQRIINLAQERKITYAPAYSPLRVPSLDEYQDQAIEIAPAELMKGYLGFYELATNKILIHEKIWNGAHFSHAHIPALELRATEIHEKRHRYNYMKAMRAFSQAENLDLEHSNPSQDYRKIEALLWADEISARLEDDMVYTAIDPKMQLKELSDPAISPATREPDGNMRLLNRPPGARRASLLYMTFAAANEIGIASEEVLKQGIEAYQECKQRGLQSHQYTTPMIQAMYDFVVKESSEAQALHKTTDVFELGKRQVLRNYLRSQLFIATCYDAMAMELTPEVYTQLHITRNNDNELTMILFNPTPSNRSAELQEADQLIIKKTKAGVSVFFASLNRINGIAHYPNQYPDETHANALIEDMLERLTPPLREELQCLIQSNTIEVSDYAPPFEIALKKCLQEKLTPK